MRVRYSNATYVLTLGTTWCVTLYLTVMRSGLDVAGASRATSPPSRLRSAQCLLQGLMRCARGAWTICQEWLGDEVTAHAAHVLPLLVVAELDHHPLLSLPSLLRSGDVEKWNKRLADYPENGTSSRNDYSQRWLDLVNVQITNQIRITNHFLAIFERDRKIRIILLVIRII